MLLGRRKAPGQSFSQVIKAHFRPEPTVREFRKTLSRLRVGGDMIEAVEQQIRGRRDHPARVVKL